MASSPWVVSMPGVACREKSTGDAKRYDGGRIVAKTPTCLVQASRHAVEDGRFSAAHLTDFVTALGAGSGTLLTDGAPSWSQRPDGSQPPRRESPPAENRLALVDEGLRSFAVVLGEAGAGMVPGLEVEAVLERAGLGSVHVALHVAQGHARSSRQARRQRLGFLLEPGVGDDAVDQAQRQRLRRVHDFRRVVELARLGGADELGQEPATSEIARVAYPRERGGEARRVGRDAQIASQGQRQPGAGGGA